MKAPQNTPQEFPIIGRSKEQLFVEADGLETIAKLIENESNPERRSALEEIEAQARCI